MSDERGGLGGQRSTFGLMLAFLVMDIAYIWVTERPPERVYGEALYGWASCTMTLWILALSAGMEITHMLDEGDDINESVCYLAFRALMICVVASQLVLHVQPAGRLSSC